jgi:signal peptidase I
MTSTEAFPQQPNLKAAPERRQRDFLSQVGNVLGTIVAVIVAMVAAVVIVIAAATRLSSKQQYTAFGHPVLVVLSGSMSPAIKTGDLIYDNGVSASGATRLHAGQIITFYDSPGSTTVITHRIVKVVHRGGQVLYQTKGDSNNAPDAALRPASTVIGTYEGKIPRGGYFLFNLHKPIVLALLLMAPILWFVAEPLRRWARELDEPKDPSDSDGVPEEETP